jgi:hypothetical protein
MTREEKLKRIKDINDEQQKLKSELVVMLSEIVEEHLIREDDIVLASANPLLVMMGIENGKVKCYNMESDSYGLFSPEIFLLTDLIWILDYFSEYIN